MLEILIDPDGLLYDPSVVDFLSPPEKERLKELIAGKQGQLKEEHDFHANLADNFGTAESVAWWVDVGTTLLGVGGAVNTFIKGGVKALIAKAPQAAVGISAKYGGRKLGEGMAAGKK